MHRALLLTALLVPTLGLQFPRAECVRIQPKEFLKPAENEMVFSGKVVEVTPVGAAGGARATFEVDRVWKGRVPSKIDVFMGYYGGSPELPRYETGRSYAVVAQRLSNEKARASLGVGDPQAVVFVGAVCSGNYVMEEFVKPLGRGQPPVQQQVLANDVRIHAETGDVLGTELSLQLTQGGQLDGTLRYFQGSCDTERIHLSGTLNRERLSASGRSATMAVRLEGTLTAKRLIGRMSLTGSDGAGTNTEALRLSVVKKHTVCQ
jgi:hypothetical protein